MVLKKAHCLTKNRFFQVFGEGTPEEQVKGQGTKLLKLKKLVNRLVF